MLASQTIRSDRKRRGHTPPSATTPKQARSEATLARLLDAAEALIEEKGLADTSIPEIVRRAGSSVGGFYARFADKDALLRALEERFLEEVRQLLDELVAPGRWEDATVPQIVETCARTLVQVHRDRRPLLAAFMVRAAQDPTALDEGLRFRREASARFVELLRTRHESFAHPDPELAVDLMIQFAFGLMHQMAVFGEIRVGDRVLSDEELAREVTRNCLSYIGVRDAVDSCEPATRAQ